ncbi:MAG: hypothetical protein ACI4RV_07830 [Eubacteriales bacterium]
MDKKTFQNPANEYRIYRLLHGAPSEYAEHLDALADYGFGGIVTNAAWHNKPEDTRQYLAEAQDFADLDRQLDICREKGFGVWLYDEKGYPSGSADGLTLKDHPEYEARGFTELVTDGRDYELAAPFEKIIYACKSDGSAVPFDAHTAHGADRCYVVKPVFEGSHAEKCGWGPRRYPNLMDKDAVAAFIHCTYDKYYDSVRNFNDFEAVFTDEPSLMSAYVNCPKAMEYAFLPWQDELPAVFERMHGVCFFSVIGELFDESDTFRTGKLMFWQTVAEMVNSAYFVQIEHWCAKHGIRFSGHCLLEESLAMHIPLYGDLLKCLKSFDYPGVDMLTGDPQAMRSTPTREFQYAMAAKYVGSAARMTGKTEKVMVEICPLPGRNGGKEYTTEQEIGTMNLIFMCGINHINSYLAPERLGERFKEYADTFARAAFVLRGARWSGKIGMYYPIETAQGCYAPSRVGINNGAKLSSAGQIAEDTMFALYGELCESGLDFTIVDADWLREAQIEDGVMSANGLEISTLVMPGVRYLDSKTREVLSRFEKQGGLVLWTAAAPQELSVTLCEYPVEALKQHVNYGLCADAAHPRDLFVSPYEKDGKRVYYLINAGAQPNQVRLRLADGAPFEVWHTADGSVTAEDTVTLAPYTSVFVCEA